jgi:hypothetical protein
LSIRWKWYQREGNLISGRKKRWIPDFLASGNFLVRSVFLSVIFLTANEFIFPDLNPWFAFLSCVAGIIISDLIYWGVGKKHHGKWSKVAFLRMSVISTMTASFLVLVANLWFYNQF